MTRRSSAFPKHDKRYPTSYYDVEEWKRGDVWAFVQGYAKLYDAKLHAVRQSLRTGRATRISNNGKELWHISKVSQRELNQLVADVDAE